MMLDMDEMKILVGCSLEAAYIQPKQVHPRCTAVYEGKQILAMECKPL